MSKQRTWVIAASTILAALQAGATLADPPSAKTCLDHLSPVGQTMFRAVAEHVKPDSNLADLMRLYVRPLVVSGRVDREVAKANAPDVGRCLLLLK